MSHLYRHLVNNNILSSDVLRSAESEVTVSLRSRKAHQRVRKRTRSLIVDLE